MENVPTVTVKIKNKLNHIFKNQNIMSNVIGAITRSRSNSLIDTEYVKTPFNSDDITLLINAYTDADTDANTDTDTDTDTDTEIESIFDEYYEDIIEMIHELMDEYINVNVLDLQQPDFYERMYKELHTHIKEYFINIKSSDFNSDLITHEIMNNIQELFDCFVSSKCIPRRSYSIDDSVVSHTRDTTTNIQMQIEFLKSIKQPEQRTNEWYTFRHNLISASNLWKVFGSQAQKNSLIYEKCKPLQLNSKSSTFVNTNNALHWGVKYEPVTVNIYEQLFKTHVCEFGCIQHIKYPFLGASPDGINIDPNSNKYGRMLEIKNIYNRDITGVPKLEYWVQTQIQMECCNLKLCDFMETRIKEYENSDQFYGNMYNPEFKGVLLQFTNEDLQIQTPQYVYLPFDIAKDELSITKWIVNQKQIQLENKHVLVNVIYWYLDEYSCVVIERNQEWFNSALPYIQETWNTIENERIHGYDHRESKKRSPSIVIDTSTYNDVKLVEEINTTHIVKVNKQH